ncbi:hypothetical protein Agabi119p4_5875 [Agaricus bisporus var. burnettii]|uniref:Uncharacterized protein n=1 Tax=Agaricus bisporus var. burnettii TaxID=192524 RepID=A0A8H7F0T6_AGABI|nr:hypothetical protein Agabi119p4_5875 [Agaricus bisporus var. burnettii]
MFRSPLETSGSLELAEMCHYRQVNKHFSCGHVVVQPDELIICFGTRCKFSPKHPQDCMPPNCSQTCWQYRQAPERYTLQINGPCHSCGG